ncbi:hypothetical protein ACFYRN_30020 [Streptomyces sp. NPDC005227]
MAGTTAFSLSAQNDTSELRWFYLAMGLAVTGVVRYRLQRRVRSDEER